MAATTEDLSNTEQCVICSSVPFCIQHLEAIFNGATTRNAKPIFLSEMCICVGCLPWKRCDKKAIHPPIFVVEFKPLTSATSKKHSPTLTERTKSKIFGLKWSIPWPLRSWKRRWHFLDLVDSFHVQVWAQIWSIYVSKLFVIQISFPTTNNRRVLR